MQKADDMPPTVSVIINTYNRAESLRRTLASLEQLDYPTFEVIVVDGPSTDDTGDVLTEYGDKIKVSKCEDRNLSHSRNLGISHAAGEIVAFLDDDAYADPAWLSNIVHGFDAWEVAAVGGPVYDHTGASLQSRYSVATRFGEAWVEGDLNPSDLLGRPGGTTFPYTIGTNSAFLRERLTEIGGFDEQFDYYLDETDVCCRLLDRGYLVRLLDSGFVYHKFLPNEVRTSTRSFRNRYKVLRSTVYFAFRHGLASGSFYDVCDALARVMKGSRADYRWNVDHGLLTEADYHQYCRDVDSAFDAGLQAWRSGPRIRERGWFTAESVPFVQFPTRRPTAGRLRVCLFSQEYPPTRVNGIGRFVHALATGLAVEGHIVDVLTRGSESATVDLESGVWVHRVPVVAQPQAASDVDVPPHLWDYSASLLAELRKIRDQHGVDVVQVPNWDSEGIAVLLSGEFTTVVGLHTPLKTVLSVDPRVHASDPVVGRMTELERLMYARADGLLASGRWVVDEIEHQYDLSLDETRIGFAPHGMPDAGAPDDGETALGSERRADEVRLLYVGRLEPRKGIDTLLDALPLLLNDLPGLKVTIVGDDTIPAPEGGTYRQRFETLHSTSGWLDRVEFTGPVDDEELARRYQDCDLFVAPSRYESFGLILLEAMMRGKPVIGCEVGGMRQIIEAGQTGFLVPPGDPGSLRDRIGELVSSAELRARLGRQGRQRFEERYTVARMVRDVVAYYRRLLGRPSSEDDGPTPAVATPLSETWRCRQM